MRFLKPLHGSFSVVAALLMLWGQYVFWRGETARAFLAMLNGVGVALLALCWAVASLAERRGGGR